MVFSVALTGGIASGKTTVARMLGELGVVLVDSDELSREVVAPGTPGLAEVVARFSDSVLAADGGLDRAALGAIIFGDDQARADLNAIIHPRVRQRRAELIAAAGDTIVVSVIPLLVESGLANSFDAVIVVDVPTDLQVERLMTRNGYSVQEAIARVQAQADRDERLAQATWVIDNSGTRDQLAAQVDALWKELRAARAEQQAQPQSPP